MSATPSDPLSLTPLFEGGGEPWLPLLKPTLEALPGAATFIGPDRDSRIVPVRELTFQALKPNPPQKWKIVVFGQNPYPRVESATGIAMFDNSFTDWQDGAFGRISSIRCIIKAACIWKHKIGQKTPISDIRDLLKEHDVVSPPEWFTAMLTQGVLLLNAALTASSGGPLGTDNHTAFWRPVAVRIVEAILDAKQNADEAHRGVVFAWWGAHARALKASVLQLQKKFPAVPVKHVDYCNPAAQGDVFCKKDHFADLNRALASLKTAEVDWLPSKGWHSGGRHDAETVGRMGQFIDRTRELHKQYLERLQGVKDEGQVGLPAITGLAATPMMNFGEALSPVVKLLKGLKADVEEALEFAGDKKAKAGGLTKDEIAAVYLYTTESPFYRSLNAALRHPDRSRVTPYFPYLRLLLSGLAKQKSYDKFIYRGVAADLRAQYPVGSTVTWWGVSSCTSKLSVAQAFLGGKGKRTLFEIVPVQAVGIKSYSAFTGEEEYLLSPGTQLKVIDVTTDKDGLCTVRLEEIAGACLVS